MDQTKSEYEFLDLSDINEEERSSLTSALFPAAECQRWSSPAADKAEASQATWAEPHYAVGDEMSSGPVHLSHLPRALDLSSCSSDTAGPPTASSSLDSLSEQDMAPPPPPPAASPPRGPPPPQYSQPPPQPPQLYGSTQPPPWAPPLMPPNVYVSQVTANVNVHGYMSQYYQPHQHQYVPHGQGEPRGREGRRGRRGGPNKRAPSPPQTPYLYYPQYYPSAQTAQGAPLYHVPVYPPMGYVPGYPYNPYVEYPIMEDPGQAEKGPEEYQTEMMMEHEHMSHEMYFPPHPPHPCIPPPAMYDPNRPADGACSLEPYPAFFSLPPPPTPSTHQFNVHAKNFVRQSDHKTYNNPPQESKLENTTHSGNKMNPSNNVADSLPLKELKISSNKPPSGSPKHVSNSPQLLLKSPVILTNDKVAPKPPVDTPKPAWTVNNTKPVETSPVKPSLPVASQPAPVPAVLGKPSAPGLPGASKVNKSPVPAPFTNIKSIVKTTPPPAVPPAIVPQQTLPAKAPFATKPKKEATVKPQEPQVADPPPSSPALSIAPQANVEVKPVQPAPVVKPNPPVAIAPAPIVSKAPFSHARKPSVTTETPVVTPTPPPVAPTASDFPPPPAPRRTAEQPGIAVPVTTQPQPTAYAPSPARSWASLFDAKRAAAVQAAQQPPEEAPTPAPVCTNPSAVLPPNVVPNQKPVAKVGPFDASPLQWEAAEKSPSAPTPTISYSEKTSNGQSPKGVIPVKEESAARDNQPTQVPAHINDPNLYRMGEFLSKYQLNHHTVSLQPRGLSNRSNYCYINAILQALIACPPFYNMLKSLPHQQRKGKSATPIIDAMVELINEFTPLPPGVRPTRAERCSRPDGAPEGPALVGAGPPLEPAPVLRALRDVQAGGDSFRVDGRQEDAEEFLGCLLNGLNDEMLELIKLVEPEEPKDAPVVPNGNDVAQDSDDDDEWKVMGPKNKGSVERRCLAGRTPLSDIFRGQLRSRLQRLPAPDSPQPETTHCVQPFFTLPLDIEKSTSVRDALERVAGRERMEGVRCRERGRPVDAWSQSLLERLPAALLLHLKCFHCRPQDNSTAKILKTIEYPIDLKIDPKIITSKMKYSLKQRSYKLFAVVYHEGAELEKGHYLADAYHAGTGGWLRYDDSVVTAVSEQQVLHPRLPRTPYLLLYRRQDTMHAGAPRHPPPAN